MSAQTINAAVTYSDLCAQQREVDRLHYIATELDHAHSRNLRERSAGTSNVSAVETLEAWLKAHTAASDAAFKLRADRHKLIMDLIDENERLRGVARA